MRLTEFRKHISTELDRAIRGESVTIERSGVTFDVKVANLTSSVQKGTVMGVDFAKEGDPSVLPEPPKNRPMPLPKRHKAVIAQAAEALDQPKKTANPGITYKPTNNWGA